MCLMLLQKMSRELREPWPESVNLRGKLGMSRLWSQCVDLVAQTNLIVIIIPLMLIRR